MVTTRSTTKANTAQTPEAINTGFRLGDDHQSDQSDSDQSVHSTHSLSPSKKGAKATRSKKRRVLKEERKKVGALAEDLDTLLGAAFQAPTVEHVGITATGTVEPVIVDEVMEVEIAPVQKRLPKRTRQNMAKMEKRRLAREQQQQKKLRQENTAVDMSVDQHPQHQNQTKKNATQARRLRKEKQRARALAARGDAMEIG